MESQHETSVRIGEKDRMIKPLGEVLRAGEIIVLDGAMGTELDKRGFAGRGTCNLTAPGAVVQVHREYIAAGSTAIITNTLTMNRAFIESHGLDVDVVAVNREGVRLAREAARGEAYVLGNLSSTGRLLEPYGDISEKAALDSLTEQAVLLKDAGADGFIIETMIDLREAALAARACRAVSMLPVIACIAFETEKNGGRTVMGNSAVECVTVLQEQGVSALGANCGSIDPAQMAQVISTLSAASGVPLAAEANAGKPRLADGATLFAMEPEEFASGMLRCREAGATILGGCCGTTPDHIRALSARIRARR
jgi:5-methyltetrahydrofolate--homocysteine methyltransferase